MFATIYVPDFALQCVLRRAPELRDRTLAIVDGNLPARVRQITSLAQQRGVAPGMTTTQALGRCPTLLFRPPGSLEAESACLLQCAEGFSPWLEATGEGVVTIEWRGEQAAGKGSPEASHAIVAQLALLGFTARVGVAQTPNLALLAAHCAEPVCIVDRAADFLVPLPLETLSADAGQCAPEVQAARSQALRILHRWGIHTLGGLAALPRDQAVARLGEVAAEMWDCAAGRAQRPLRLVRAPEIFAEAMELEHEVETLEPLLFILRRFLEQLAARLDAAYRVAAILELRLTFREGAPHRRELRIPAPTCDVDVLFRVLSTHLESVTAAAPIVALALAVTPARPERQQFELFESGLRDPNKFFETLARLHALLGNDRVGTPVVEDTYRADAFHLETPQFGRALSASSRNTDPQRSTTFQAARPAVVTTAEPATTTGTAGSLTDCKSVLHAPRPTSASRANKASPPTNVLPLPGAPLQRYRPPLEAKVQDHEGRPLCVFSEKAFGEITACRGPWRSSGDWWAERAWERTEWDVQVGDVCYRLAQQGDEWFLDGSYD